MRLKFLGQRGHWKRWPEAVEVGFGLVGGSFGGRFVEPLGLLVLLLAFPADRLLLGVPVLDPSIWRS